MDEDLVQVFAAPTAIEAELVRGRLEVEGIPVLLKGEGEGPYRTGPVELFVPSTFEPQARLILESVDEASEADGSDDEAAHEGQRED
jgi:Putative prokaryotic signal transducing protein